MELDLIGKWAFIVGLVVAVLAGFITTVAASTILLILFVLGLIVGRSESTRLNSSHTDISRMPSSA